MPDARVDGFTVTRFTGLPSFRAQEQLEHEILAEAGLPDDLLESRGRERPSPHTFHVAVAGGRPVAAAVSTLGPLAEVPLGLALAAAGVEIGDLEPLPSPVAELVSLSEDRTADLTGVAEALYRSFYQQAKQQGAESLVLSIDPWVLDLLNEQYGVPFQVIGPMLDQLGRTLLPVGGRLVDLEAGIAEHAPEFLAYMQQPDDVLSQP